MKFSLHVSVDNAAFDGESGEREEEVGRILADLAGRLASDTLLELNEPIRLFDINGNRVGYAVLEEGRA